VAFDPETRTTDVIMFNSRNLGALIVAEEPHVKSWEDGQYNILNMSIEETFGLGILQEGQAVAVAKNVKVRPNEFTMPARTVFNLVSSSFPSQQGSRVRAREKTEEPGSRVDGIAVLQMPKMFADFGDAARNAETVSRSAVLQQEEMYCIELSEEFSCYPAGSIQNCFFSDARRPFLFPQNNASP
jgi:hypothetical protein